MNNDTDNEQSVRKALRSFSRETVPEDLDRAVLREAEAAHSSGFWARFYTWRRPLAFAATLVLGVTLVYDMQTVLQQSGTPYLPAPEIFEDDRSRSELDALAPKVTEDAESPAESPAQERAAPAANGASRKLAAPPAIMDTVEEQKVMSFQAQGGAENETSDKRPAKPQSVEQARQHSEPAAMNAATAYSDRSENACDDARFDSAQRWWRCVEQHRAAGENTQAEAEWHNLKRKFPDFREPPEPD